MRPRCDNLDECYKCLTSPTAPRFAPKLRFIPRSVFQACKQSSKLDKSNFDIRSFCKKDEDFRKLSKAAREDLIVFLDDIYAERNEIDAFMAEESKEDRPQYNPLEYRESHVLLKIDTEIHRAFSRINKSISGFTDTVESTFITFQDRPSNDSGYGDLNYWYDSILQDAYLLRTRLFLALDFIYALHLVETSKEFDYVEWKTNALSKFQQSFNVSSRNRLIHTRFLDSRSPVLMYIKNVDDDIRERFLRDERIQEHLKDEINRWEQYLQELRDSVTSYAGFISNSVEELELLTGTGEQHSATS